MIGVAGPFVVEISHGKLFNPTGTVTRWANKVALVAEGHAIKEAPHSIANPGPNSRGPRPFKSKANPEPAGTLIASIYSEVNRVGLDQLTITVGAGARYAEWVSRGTSGASSRIFQSRVPAGGRGPQGQRPGTFSYKQGGMFLPPNFGYKAGVPIQNVSGQAANNFLGRAFDKTARTHRSLRGFTVE